MMAGAYYNEIDPFAAAWLRQLVQAGHIAPGDVDERDIRDVSPDDLRKYTQCHFFAGIGVWSYALRSAGWADDRPVWTGSCPCQPFSAAGARGGVADERHLWPHWHHLIRECRPASIFGEQVASKDGLGWFDLVSSDMEGEGYAIGASDLCAAGVGAPHIRQRLWFYARDSREGLEHAARNGWDERWAEPSGWGLARRRGTSRLADRDDTGLEGRWQPERGRADKCVVGANSLAGWVADSALEQHNRAGFGGASGRAEYPDCRPTRGVADADNPERRSDAAQGNVGIGSNPGRSQGAGDAEGRGGYGDARATDGLWRDADWLYCRDGKWRPVEPGTFPLANGSAARVGRLRGYGNAIVSKVATTFIEAVM